MHTAVAIIGWLVLLAAALGFVRSFWKGSPKPQPEHPFDDSVANSGGSMPPGPGHHGDFGDSGHGGA